MHAVFQYELNVGCRFDSSLPEGGGGGDGSRLSLVAVDAVLCALTGVVSVPGV